MRDYGNGGMANSGIPRMTTRQWSVHNIFVSNHNVTRLDGQRYQVHSGELQPCKGICDICGAWTITRHFPTEEWRHMTPEEITTYTVPVTGEPS